MVVSFRLTTSMLKNISTLQVVGNAYLYQPHALMAQWYESEKIIMWQSVIVLQLDNIIYPMS